MSTTSAAGDRELPAHVPARCEGGAQRLFHHANPHRVASGLRLPHHQEPAGRVGKKTFGRDGMLSPIPSEVGA